MVAVKNHRHGVNNPKARLRFEITVEQALAAPMVVDPFGLYDCAPQSDGAAALVLAAEDVVDRFTDRPVWIRGVGLGLDSVMHQHKPDMTTFPATVRAAKRAFAMAGMSPADVDVAEVHDFFTGIELISYEDLGFADRFEAHKLVETETTTVGRIAAGQSERRAQGQGTPAGCHRRRAVRRDLRAAPRGGGQSGRRRTDRAGAQHRWSDGRVGGHHSGRTRSPMAEAMVDRGNRCGRALGADAGRRRAVLDGRRCGQVHLRAAVPVARVPRAVLVRGPGVAGADAAGGDPVHRAGVASR